MDIGGGLLELTRWDDVLRMSQCTLNPFLEPTDAMAVAEWFVCMSGGQTVGPVSVAQVAQGIKAGQVPSDAQIARSGGSWEEVLDARAVLEALKTL